MCMLRFHHRIPAQKLDLLSPQGLCSQRSSLMAWRCSNCALSQRRERKMNYGSGLVYIEINPDLYYRKDSPIAAKRHILSGAISLHLLPRLPHSCQSGTPQTISAGQWRSCQARLNTVLNSSQWTCQTVASRGFYRNTCFDCVIFLA